MSKWLFTTSRLAVRPKAISDAEALHVVYGDSDVMRHLGGRFAALGQTSEFVRRHIDHQRAYGFSMWSLIERASAEVVGDVGFLVCEGGVEIGWHLRRASWRHGYATEAARATLDYGFATLRFPRVSAFVETANVASVHVVEKLRMKYVRSGTEGAPPWVEYAVEAIDPRIERPAHRA